MPPVYLTGGISIPGDFIIYVVERGDTLFSISQNTQVPEWKNVYDNQLLTPGVIGCRAGTADLTAGRVCKSAG